MSLRAASDPEVMACMERKLLAMSTSPVSEGEVG